MLKLIVFDFDDTLCLTEQAAFKLENTVAEKMGFLPMSRESHIQNWGEPLETAIAERIPGIDVKIFIDHLEKELPKFIKKGEIDIICESNLHTLTKLKAQNKKTAILSSRTQLQMKHLLQPDHALASLIDAFYFKENLDYSKPDPKIFRKVLEDFDVQAYEAVYVGDSLGDALSAKGAGLDFIALLESKLRTEYDFHSVKVDYFAKKFPNILDYISKKND